MKTFKRFITELNDNVKQEVHVVQHTQHITHNGSTSHVHDKYFFHSKDEADHHIEKLKSGNKQYNDEMKKYGGAHVDHSYQTHKHVAKGNFWKYHKSGAESESAVHSEHRGNKMGNTTHSYEYQQQHKNNDWKHITGYNHMRESISEDAPPSKKIKKWIKKNTKRFNKTYGKRKGQSAIAGTAWNLYKLNVRRKK